MAKSAILRSNHQEVARLSAESLDWIYCMAGQPNAEDLLKVTDFTGKEYWCDEIEFINNIPEQKEVVINNVDKLVSEYYDSLLPHVNALCHKSILNIATWSYRQGIEEMIEKQGGHTDKIVERAKTEKQRVLITESDGEANIDWDTRGLQDVKLLLEYGLDYVNKLEKQGGKKPADKVKPKFKVGDWIIYSNEEVHLITGFDDNGYFVDKECYIPFNCEGNMRLWTIADARDGDVLTNGDCPCIFKSINEENAMFVYCGINGGGDFATKSESENNIWDDEPENYYPATKEQRDLLFQKMKEAGYEWNAEKKELKKSQRMISAEAKEAMYNKPVCSEKDGMMIEETMYFLKEYQQSNRCKDESGMQNSRTCEKWLNSLKYRLQSQSKWSKEDERLLNNMVIVIQDYYNKEDAQSLISWLNSLKGRVQPQNHWKPSKEQIIALRWVLNNVPYNKHKEEISGLLDQIKDL